MGGLRVKWRQVPCRYLASGVGVQVGERGSIQLDTGYFQVSENENVGVLGSKVIQHKPNAKQPEPVHDVGEELAAHIAGTAGDPSEPGSGSEYTGPNSGCHCCFPGYG